MSSVYLPSQRKRGRPEPSDGLWDEGISLEERAAISRKMMKKKIKPTGRSNLFPEINPAPPMTVVRSPTLVQGEDLFDDDVFKELEEIMNEPDVTDLKDEIFSPRRNLCVPTSRPITRTEKQKIDIADKSVTLYLSRTSTRMSSRPRVTSSFPAVSSSKPSLVSREFTFTGYDIMTDTVESSDQTSRPPEERKLRRIYEAACKANNMTPASYLCDRLTCKSVSMKSHNLGAAGAKAVAVALVNNNKVEELSIEDNDIREDGARCMADMISVNEYLTDLNLSENNIKGLGAQAICEALISNITLRKLDLSGNGLKDADAPHLCNLLKQNIYLRELRLSHNTFSGRGGSLLGKSLIVNDTLELLDLSWNHLRCMGAISFSRGVMYNRGLKTLNLAWNGLGLEGASSMATAIHRNYMLEEVDLSSNRLYGDSIDALMKGLEKSQSLVRLKITQNPISVRVARFILKSIENMPRPTELKEVDISDVAVDEKFSIEAETVYRKTGVRVKHGYIIRYGDASLGEDVETFEHVDPRDILYAFMESQGLRVIDLMKRMDKDGSFSVSRAEFKRGLMSVNIPMSSSQLDNLLDALDKDGDGEVDLSELLIGSKNFKRQRMLTKTKQAKKKKQSFKNVGLAVRGMTES